VAVTTGALRGGDEGAMGRRVVRIAVQEAQEQPDRSERVASGAGALGAPLPLGRMMPPAGE
jgi:hypothetical protein